MDQNLNGSVLISSMLVLVLFLVLITGLSSLIFNEFYISSYEKNYLRAFYIAEAGFNYASKLFAKNQHWNHKGELNETDLNGVNQILTTGKLLSITRKKVKDQFEIKSVGQSQDITRTVTALLGNDLGENFALKNSLVSQGKMVIFTKTVVKGKDSSGDLYSNDDIVFTDSVNTDGSYNRVSDKTLVSLLNCNYYPNQQIDFPVIDLEDVRSQPELNNDLTNIGGNISYFSGDITTTSPLYINGKGIMLIDGDLKINDKLYYNVSGNESFILIVNGDLEINELINGSGLIYSYGDIHINNLQNYTGSIIAEGLVEDSSGSLIFDQAIDLKFDHSYQRLFKDYQITVTDSNGNNIFDYKIISWTEQ